LSAIRDTVIISSSGQNRTAGHRVAIRTRLLFGAEAISSGCNGDICLGVPMRILGALLYSLVAHLSIHMLV